MGTTKLQFLPLHYFLIFKLLYTSKWGIICILIFTIFRIIYHPMANFLLLLILFKMSITKMEYDNIVKEDLMPILHLARKVQPQCLKVKCTWRHSCLLFPMECHFLLVLVLKLNSKMTMYFWTVAHNVPMQFHQVMVHIFFSLCVYVHPCLF